MEGHRMFEKRYSLLKIRNIFFMAALLAILAIPATNIMAYNWEWDQGHDCVEGDDGKYGRFNYTGDTPESAWVDSGFTVKGCCEIHCMLCPVYANTGEYQQSYTDLQVPGIGPSLNIIRTYNSLEWGTSLFGHSWIFNLGRQLIVAQNEAGEKILGVRQNTGERNYFRELDDGTIEKLTIYGVPYDLIKNTDGTYTLKNQDGSLAYELNIDGKIKRIVDRNGNALIFQYNSVGCLERITNASGNYVNIQLGPNGKIASISDNLDRSVSYGYDDSGNLISVTDPMGNTTQYGYNSRNLLAQIIDARGNVVTLITYEENDPPRVASFTEKGETYSFAYYDGRAEKTDSQGNKWIAYYTEQGIIEREVDPLGNEISRQLNNIKSTSEDWVSDPNGNRTNFTYDDYGNVTSKTDPLGSTETFTYLAGTSLLDTKTDRMGKVTKYEYDSNGRRTKIIEDFGGSSEKTTIFNYSSNGNLISTTDPLGYTTSYEYDTHGNLIKTTDPLGNIIEKTYDSRGNRLTEKDANGNTISLTYDLMNRLTSVIDKLGNASTYTYDENGNVSSQTDANGNTKTFTYDTYNRKLTETDSHGNTTSYTYDSRDNILSETDARSNTTTYVYDISDRVTRVTNSFGESTDYTYDNSGNSLTFTNGYEEITSYSYDEINRIISVTGHSGNTTTYSYDSNGRKTQETNHKGEIITYAYDINGNLTRVTDPTGEHTDYTYDLKGNKLSVTDANGKTTSFVYDALNRMASKTNAAGGVTTYTYNSLGDILTTTLPNGNTVTYSYNDTGQLVSKSDSMGQLVSYTYDSNGRLITQIDALGNIVTYAYNQVGQMTSITDSMGNPANYSYDNYGNVISITDRTGNIYSNTYDNYNRPLTSIDPLGNVTTYTYNKGDLVSITDANGNVTQYSYDRANRIRQTTYADGTSRSFTYDTDGRLISRTDQNGNTTAYAYDSLNRLTMLDYPGENDSYFSYDAVGSLLAANNQNATVSLSYDDMYRISQIIQNGSTVSFSFDNANGTAATTYPGGRSFTRLLNQRGALARIEDADSNVIIQYNYDSIGRILTKVYPNGITANCAYNVNSWLSSLSYQNSNNNVLYGYQYNYNNEGNITSINKTHMPENSRAYTFDSKQRLTQFEIGTIGSGGDIQNPTTQTRYNLDALQNWISKTTDGVTENRTHNQINALTAIDGTTLVYDNNGNLIDDNENTYQYDYENCLVKITRKSDAVVLAEYKYDALGRRGEKAVSGVTTGYVYNGGSQVLCEYEDGGLKQEYIYGIYIDEPIVMIKSDNSKYFYHQNQQFSVVALSDAGGNIVEEYNYTSPYGTMMIYDGTGTQLSDSDYSNSYSFTGRRWDSESGIWYFRNRSYSDRLGRFLSHDPSGFSDGMNLYAAYFVPGGMDPFGLWKKVGLWTYSGSTYSGKVEAECIKDKDTLEELAYLITGNRSDASVFGNMYREITLGQEIKIGPLLQKLEDRLRQKVVSATSWVENNIPWHSTKTLYGKGPYYFECKRAANAVFATAMYNHLKSGEFHPIFPGYSIYINFAGLPYDFKVATTPSGALEGDWGYIKNFEDYFEKHPTPPNSMQGENVVKVGVDKFWGFGGKPTVKNLQGWKEALARAYNGSSDTTGMPGWRPSIVAFYDIPEVATKIFNYRK